MAGPGVLLVLGGLLGSARGGGVPENPPGYDFEVEAEQLLAQDPQDPKCFSRRLHDLTCFWDSDHPPEPPPFRFQFRLEHEPWRSCSVGWARRPGGGSRFWCRLPPDAAVAFVPLELLLLPPPPATPRRRTLLLDQVVLLGPPANVSVVPGGGRGQLCVRWDPPPNPYLESSLVYELLLEAPGLPPRTVAVGAGRREQRVGGLPGRTRFSARLRARPDGLSYGGFWSPWSPPGSGWSPPDMDPVTLGLSCLLALLLLGLALLALLGHRRMLQEKLWPPVPGPEREFEGLFSAYGGNFQLWLCQGVGAPWIPPGPPPEAEELPSALEEVGPSPPPLLSKGLPPSPTPPPTPAPPPPPGPSPSPSFEYTLFDPNSALLCPPPAAPPLPPSPYANLDPPKRGPPQPPSPTPPPPPALGPPPYVICS